MLKHAFYEDPTLTDDEPKMLSVSVYDLSNATVSKAIGRAIASMDSYLP